MPQYLPALVIQKNNQLYISTAGISAQYTGSGEIVTGLGLLTEIPSPEGGGVIDFDCWATPVGEGLVDGFIFTPYNANDPIGSIQPTVQSFKCFRIYNRLASDYWYVLGTVAEYITADNGGADLPTTLATLQAAFQVLCQFVNSAQTQYGVVMALPSLVAPNDRYFPYGYINGVAMPGTPTASGYTTVAALLAFLNANWTNIGSPATAITWTVSADGITLVGLQANGGGGDIIAAQIAAINPSL